MAGGPSEHCSKSLVDELIIGEGEEKADLKRMAEVLQMEPGKYSKENEIPAPPLTDGLAWWEAEVRLVGGKIVGILFCDTLGTQENGGCRVLIISNAEGICISVDLWELGSCPEQVVGMLTNRNCFKIMRGLKNKWARLQTAIPQLPREAPLEYFDADEIALGVDDDTTGQIESADWLVAEPKKIEEDQRTLALGRIVSLPIAYIGGLLMGQSWRKDSVPALLLDWVEWQMQPVEVREFALQEAEADFVKVRKDLNRILCRLRMQRVVVENIGIRDREIEIWYRKAITAARRKETVGFPDYLGYPEFKRLCFKLMVTRLRDEWRMDGFLRRKQQKRDYKNKLKMRKAGLVDEEGQERGTDQGEGKDSEACDEVPEMNNEVDPDSAENEANFGLGEEPIFEFLG